jgi:GT2 family glycosyltransferase
MKSTFTFLVVLFSKNIEDSSTIQSLIRNANLVDNEMVYVWDNSPLPLSIEVMDLLNQTFKQLKYHHTPENIVLSKVYNSVIEEIEQTSSYLVLLDDDSELPDSFFTEIIKSTFYNSTIELFLPQIYSNGVLVSPAKDYLFKTALMTNVQIGLYRSNYLTAINSGMVIKTDFFKKGFRYNEKLNFYGTDNFFMFEYAKQCENLIVIDVKIHHDLSYNSSGDINKKIKIFREIKRANKIIYADDWFKLRLVSFNNFVVAVKKCFAYKTLAFLHD